MKKIIIFPMLLAITAISFCQQINPKQPLAAEEYFQKSKTKKNSAWLLLGTGVTVLAGTLISAAGNVCIGPGCTKRSFPVVPVGIGVAAMVSSIPLFIASGKNKRKGMSLSFKNEPASQLQKSSIVYRRVPSLTLKISL